MASRLLGFNANLDDSQDRLLADGIAACTLCVSLVYSETVVQEDFDLEMMVKLNEPVRRNGEQALWVDGVKIIHEKRFRWRDSEILKLNLSKFGLYIHYCERDCTYWVDDMVISTEYVGPKA